MKSEGNSGSEPADRWVLGSVHRWNESEKRPRSALTDTSAYGPNEWAVVVHWRVVDGLAVPVGLDLRSSLHGSRKGAKWPEGDVPKEVSREVFKRLPVGELIRQGREQVAAVWGHLQGQQTTPEGDRVARALIKAGRSSSRSDWKYRETAKAYAAALDDPRIARTRVALATWKRLQQHEHPELQAITYERTRKNITKARERGYLSADTKTPGDTPSSGDDNES